MVKLTRKTMAVRMDRTGVFARKRFCRYSGRVMESFAAFENFLRRLATKIQLRAVPMARPMPIQALPRPKARTEPGRPMRSHADMSEACALRAVTQGPI